MLGQPLYMILMQTDSGRTILTESACHLLTCCSMHVGETIAHQSCQSTFRDEGSVCVVLRLT